MHACILFAFTINLDVENTLDEEDCHGHVGHLVYTRDNHTSVLGLREIVAEKGVSVHSISHEAVFEEFSRATAANRSVEKSGNALFVYPAQCNFSGCKYPLQWIERVSVDRALDDFIMRRNAQNSKRW